MKTLDTQFSPGTERGTFSRRHMLKLIGGTVGLAALAACGATQPAPAPAPTETTAPAVTASTAAPAAEGVKIRWYANADATRNKWMEEVAIPDFAVTHPEYTIEPIIVPWDEFDPKLTSMFAAGDLPEVFANWGSTGYAEYALRCMCIYMDDYIKAADAELNVADFAPSSVEGVKVRGKLVGLPMYILGTYTYYNKDLFDAASLAYPPSNWDDESWTWDTMLETAHKLTKNYEDPTTGQYGVVMGLGSPEEMPWLWDWNIWPAGTVENGIATEILFDETAVIDAFQHQYDLVCKEKVTPDQAISSALSAAGDPFQAGKVAMNMSGGWGFWNLKEVAGTFRWGAGSLPRWKKGVLTDALYADPMLISAQTSLKDQAWEFVKYLYSQEGQRKFTVATWSPPARKSILADWVNLWPEDLRADLTQSLEGSWKYGITTPWNRIAGYSQIYDPIYSTLDSVALCEKSMAEVAPEVEAKVNEILAGLKFEACA
jgi:multiple sugar transport system substrate-binding protein